MLLNYVKTAWRALWRRRTTTAVNVAGLSVSLAVCFLVVLFLQQQWALDRFHPDADRIHFVASSDVELFDEWIASAPVPLANALRSQATGAESVTQIRTWTTFATREEQSVSLEAYLADSSFFDVFSGFQLRAGDRETALNRPHSVVLTADAQQRFFADDADPMGETIRIRGEQEYTVTGVLEPPSGPTHLAGDVYLSDNTSSQTVDTEAWTNAFSGRWTYVRLADGSSPDDLQTVVEDVYRRNVPESKHDAVSLKVFSMDRHRFGGTIIAPVSNRAEIPQYFFLFFAGLAAIVLLASGFNYVNLTTAQSLHRMKEVGVRKSIGAHRKQIAGQFLCEAVLTSLVAAGGAVVVLSWMIPFFNDFFIWSFLGIPSLSVAALSSPGIMLLLVGVALVFGLLAGLYPAVVFSKSNPTSVLSAAATVSSPFGTLSVRKLLIGVQFAMAVVLVVTATTLFRQSTDMQGSDHVLKTDRIVNVDLQNVNYAAFREAALRLPDIEFVTATNNVLLGDILSRESLMRHPDAPAIKAYDVVADTTFVQNMGLTLSEADVDWTVDYSSGKGVLINESAADALGFDPASDALGETIFGKYAGEPTGFRVLGIVENFQFLGIEMYAVSNDYAVPPMVMRMDPSELDQALVRVASEDVAGMRDRLQATWTSELETQYPFQARFYSDVTRQRYGPMQDLTLMGSSVALLAVLITILGLLNVAAHSVQSRTQEIGIRKALGATVSNIVLLLSSDFARIVGVATAIALPAAWLLNAWWLRFLPDSVTVGSGALALTVCVLLVTSLMTIGSQTIRAARLSPVDTLRSE